eukprot:gene4755-9451_t
MLENSNFIFHFTFLSAGILLILAITIIVSFKLPKLTDNSYDQQKYSEIPMVSKQNPQEFVSPHFLLDEYLGENMCLSSTFKGDSLHHNVNVLKESLLSSFQLQIPYHSSKFYQLCISKHHHQHKMTFKLQSTDESSDCDMYFSATTRQPNKIQWDWKSNNKGNDKISLTTYMDEYLTANTGGFYIGIDGKEEQNNCNFTILIEMISNEELLHKVNLRGGQKNTEVHDSDATIAMVVASCCKYNRDLKSADCNLWSFKLAKFGRQSGGKICSLGITKHCNTHTVSWQNELADYLLCICFVKPPDIA